MMDEVTAAIVLYCCNNIVVMVLLLMQDCRDAQSRDSKEFAAFFNEGNVQVHAH